MKEIHSIYGLNIDDNRYRNKLKNRIINQFGDELTFLHSTGNFSEVIASKASLDRKTHWSRDDSIKIVAKYLKDDIKDKCENLSELSWPITIEQLLQEDRSPPDSVKLFLEHLLRTDTHTIESGTTVQRLIDSYAQDLVHGVTRG